MFKLCCAFILTSVLATPVAWGAFHVYTGNLKVYERDDGIRYYKHNVSDKQCMRSRYGNAHGPWPCSINHRYIPGDVRNERLYIYTHPYGKKLYSPGMRELLVNKP